MNLRRMSPFVLVTAVGLHATYACAGVALFGGPQGTAAVTTAINNAGTSVGRISPNKSFGFRWNDRGMTELMPVAAHPNWSVLPTTINGSGLSAGAISWGFEPDRGQAMAWLPGSNDAIELSRQGANGATYNTGSLDYAQISDLNAQDSIVGSMIRRNASGTALGRVAVRWDGPNAAPVELQGLPLATLPLGSTYTGRQNNSGTLVGISLRTAQLTGMEGTRWAVRWAPGSTVPQKLDDLSTSTSASWTMAYDINNAGVAVGTSDRYANNTANRIRPAVRWDPVTSAVTALDLPASNGGIGVAEATAINDAGNIFGVAAKWVNGSYTGHIPARWSASGTQITELATLGPTNFTFSSPSIADVNAAGVAAGLCYRIVGSSDARRAVLWNAETTAVLDLNSLIGNLSEQWTLEYATSISDTGWVGGMASFDADGAGSGAKVDRAFSILVPQAGTYGRGDANFDTKINFDDLLILAQNYGSANPSQNIHVGDLNLDGSVNFDDLLTLAQHYEANSTSVDASVLGSSFAAEWNLARSLVPEPGLGLGLVIACGLIRRRRAIPV